MDKTIQNEFNLEERALVMINPGFFFEANQ
jgi:hypothetical protein